MSLHGHELANRVSALMFVHRVPERFSGSGTRQPLHGADGDFKRNAAQCAFAVRSVRP
jgi:hypothetical protein